MSASLPPSGEVEDDVARALAEDIGSGDVTAALFAAAMLAPGDAAIASALAAFRERQTADVVAADDPRK